MRNLAAFLLLCTFDAQAIAEMMMQPMSRQISGTAWQPDSTQMPMLMLHASGWHFMFHGNVNAGLDWQSSSRGGNNLMSTNWIMGSASHALGPGTATARVMLSFEPLTIPAGYPLLFQSGETYQGVAIHDRQHPHDFFMELAAKYELPMAGELGLEFYGALSGEPALGPVAFPHRSSAKSNPLAPLGHHWYDSTHISFGVLTLGLFGEKWKLEGSWFNGREPDENRWNFDFRALDSFSGRFAINPDEDLSAQLSYGFLKSPESHNPDVSVHRLTTSALVNKEVFGGVSASSATLGVNMRSAGPTTVFGLVEEDFAINDEHTLFGRLEAGQKTGDELVLPLGGDTVYGIVALSLGYAYHLPQLSKLMPSLGAVGTLYTTGSELGTFYNGAVQAGAMVYLQVGLSD